MAKKQTSPGAASKPPKAKATPKLSKKPPAPTPPAEPEPPRKLVWMPTTQDTTAAKKKRVEDALADPAYRDVSNRAIARELGVDEWMVRKYRAKLNLPKLLPGSGKPADDKPTKRRKTR